MIRSFQLTCAVFFLIAFFSACEKKDAPSFQTEAEAKVILNLSYGSAPQQIMDVYLPPNRTSNTTLLIFIHGGSFIGGDKSNFTSHAKELARSGFAVANINYRLVDGSGLFQLPVPHKESAVKVKDQVSDVSAAVDFAIAKSKEWVVSNSRVAMAGHSAGGTLALLYGYDARNTNKVKAISNIAGALDLIFTNVPNWQFLPPFVLEGGYRYTGFTVDAANEKQYKEISPLYTANAGKTVPTLNVFPQNNEVLGLPKQDLSTFNEFSNVLNKLKVPNKLYFVSGADHDFTNPRDWLLVLEQTRAYFNAQIK